MMPLPIVLATAVPVKAPARLHTPASIRACLGRMARLPMEAATALAASLKPLEKPKAMAVAKIITTTAISDIL